MRRLVEVPPLADALGQAARRRIESGFTIQRSIAGLWSILEGCLSRHTESERLLSVEG
jgi:hypothetical protein